MFISGLNIFFKLNWHNKINTLNYEPALDVLSVNFSKNLIKYEIIHLFGCINFIKIFIKKI